MPRRSRVQPRRSVRDCGRRRGLAHAATAIASLRVRRPLLIASLNDTPSYAVPHTCSPGCRAAHGRTLPARRGPRCTARSPPATGRPTRARRAALMPQHLRSFRRGPACHRLVVERVGHSGRRAPPSITRSSTMPVGRATREDRRLPHHAERRQALGPRHQVAVAIEGPGDVRGAIAPAPPPPGPAYGTRRQRRGELGDRAGRDDRRAARAGTASTTWSASIVTPPAQVTPPAAAALLHATRTAAVQPQLPPEPRGQRRRSARPCRASKLRRRGRRRRPLLPARTSPATGCRARAPSPSSAGNCASHRQPRGCRRPRCRATAVSTSISAASRAEAARRRTRRPFRPCPAAAPARPRLAAAAAACLATTAPARSAAPAGESGTWRKRAAAAR